MDRDPMDIDNSDVQRKGRGFQAQGREQETPETYSSLEEDSVSYTTTASGLEVMKSVEGWVVLVTNIHEEASEADLKDIFLDYGEISSLHLNLDRRTGYVKGYALVEYPTLAEAKAAIEGTNNTKFLEQTISSEFAFVKAPPRLKQRESRRQRARSHSPER